MVTEEEYRKALSTVKQYRQQCINVITEIDRHIDKYYDLRNTKIRDTDLSIRAKNVLMINFIELVRHKSVVKELANISRRQLSKCRGLGIQSLSEIDELCQNANIKMMP